ncbi:uncharacterized protein [Choristoneura fumiferana]|uniref:uncharacterized protein n=1 Tax=Choristoneura fumiferana TaxID=7141 RepID=UPI003D15DCB4
MDLTLILSQVGAQQGDPLGPLTFSLAIHKVIAELRSPLNVWYLDDGTIGGRPEEVERDLLVLLPRLRDLGLEVNTAKCEFFPCGRESCALFPLFSSLLPGLRELNTDSFCLLGAPIFPSAVPEALEIRRDLLLFASERLKGINPHVALALMQKCFAVPKMTYLLRTAPAWLFPDDVGSFDVAIKSAVESITNVSMSDNQWAQAALPIRYGGIGVRRLRDVSLPAFLASAHGVAGLVSNILSLDGDGADIPYVAGAVVAWSALNPGATVPEDPAVQRGWDDVGCRATLDRLINGAAGADLARLLAVSRSESGAWLHALPSPQLGTLLDGDSLRVSVALRLGCDVCQPHLCICGTMVGADGHHALSCRRCAGRHPRHHALNDIVQRALRSAGVPSVLEPPGLSRTDGKRPDGLTLVPWEGGRCLVWDATCVSTFAASISVALHERRERRPNLRRL